MFTDIPVTQHTALKDVYAEVYRHFSLSAGGKGTTDDERSVAFFSHSSTKNFLKRYVDGVITADDKEPADLAEKGFANVKTEHGFTKNLKTLVDAIGERSLSISAGRSIS